MTSQLFPLILAWLYATTPCTHHFTHQPLCSTHRFFFSNFFFLSIDSPSKPESLLLRRKNTARLRAQRAKQLKRLKAGKKANVKKRKKPATPANDCFSCTQRLIAFKRAEKYVKEYRDLQKVKNKKMNTKPAQAHQPTLRLTGCWCAERCAPAPHCSTHRQLLPGARSQAGLCHPHPRYHRPLAAHAQDLATAAPATDPQRRLCAPDARHHANDPPGGAIRW